MSELLRSRPSDPDRGLGRSNGCRSEQGTGTRAGPIRIAAAVAIATIADTIGAPIGETAGIVFDAGVALLLAAALGPRPLLLLALVVECIPLVGLFPTWVAAVAVLARGSGERS